MSSHRKWRFSSRWVVAALLFAMVAVLVAGAAAAAIETDTVSTYWRGLFWAVSLITTVGFVGQPPQTDSGAALSVGLMVVGFVLLSIVSAFLAALFVREDEQPHAVLEESNEHAILAALDRLEARLDNLERQLAQHEGP